MMDMSWQPIETAPKALYPMIVAIAKFDDGYVTDPWCVWWQEGTWVRWPHDKPPTHWCALDPFPPDEKKMMEMALRNLELKKMMQEIKGTSAHFITIDDVVPEVRYDVTEDQFIDVGEDS